MNIEREQVKTEHINMKIESLWYDDTFNIYTDDDFYIAGLTTNIKDKEFIRVIFYDSDIECYMEAYTLMYLKDSPHIPDNLIDKFHSVYDSLPVREKFFNEYYRRRCNYPDYAIKRFKKKFKSLDMWKCPELKRLSE